MGLFEHWPYLNFHDLNLDWIIKEFPKVYASRDEAKASAEASADSASASQLSADASQNSAEASQQSAENAATSEENAAESEENAKNYADHIADPVAGLVTHWLDDHVTPTTPIVDNTLTIEGAAADAKKTGDEISEIKQVLNQVVEPFEVTNSTAGGINVAYPMLIGDSIIVTNKTPASIEVRQRDESTTVIATTIVLSGNTKKITSNVDSTDIRFYFNQGGTILFENADKRLPIVEEKVDEIDQQKGVQSFVIDHLFDSTLLFHRADYHSDELSTDVVIAEYDVEYPYTALYVKADSMDDVTNNYPIGIKEYDANNALLGATGRTKAGCLRGVSIPLNYLPNTKKVKVYINVGVTASNSIKNVFIWSTRFGRVENKPYPVFHVEKDGSGEFTTLVDAIIEATQYMDAKIYLGAGTWDIIDELGAEYLANVGSTQRGLYLKNRVHLICDSRSKIVANYTGNLDNVKTWLSIFNSGEYGFTLENATLEGSNIRYLIHDERDQDTDAYINKYINCKMVFDNRNNSAWTAKQCIGGGLGQNGYVDIEGCSFKSYQGYDGTVSYHNSSGANAKSHIVVRDCYFYFYNTFRLSWYGTSTEITEAIVTGCYLGDEIVHRAENSSATTENTSIVEWNNTVNQH